MSAAKAWHSLETGLVYGAKRVNDALSHLGAEPSKSFPAFELFLDAISPDLPLGELRLLRTENLLRQSDKALAAIEAKHRASVWAECIRVI